MEILYFDESGDDGFGPGASPLFALTCLRISSDDWSSWSERIDNFRLGLTETAGLPKNHELHIRQLLLRKGRYHEMQIRTEAILAIIKAVNELVSDYPVLIHSEIVQKTSGTQPLRATLIAHILKTDRLNLAISDRGRVPRMRYIIKQDCGRGAISHPPIENMLEIESRDCPFVQLADFFATAAYLRASSEIGWPHHARINPTEAGAMIQATEGANRTYRLICPDGTA